jgi:hypothetical protein
MERLRVTVVFPAAIRALARAASESSSRMGGSIQATDERASSGRPIHV